MDLGLKGKTALVFGAGGGLGAAIAVSLAAEGTKTVLADIDEHALGLTASHLHSLSASTLGMVWDLGDLHAIDKNFNRIQAAFGPVDILVNNTGGPPPTRAREVAVDIWERNFRTMVLSVITITDRVLPAMRSRRWGRIITSTSSGVIAPIPNLGISNTLRTSLVAWSKTLAREIAADGVTANIVVPGRIATRRIQQLDETRAGREKLNVEQVVAESVQSIPAGRYGRPEEYGDVVAFLASARSSYVTGSIIRVDGGYIASI
jgi:3-oxoacyl-[acyl-carrier protein] reductase